MEQLKEIFGEPVYTYTRAQAIEDGCFADVSDQAREVGFRCPVALTSTLWATVNVEGNEALVREGQSTAGRLHDVLFLAMLKVRAAAGRPFEGPMKCAFRVLDGSVVRSDEQELWLYFGPGDNGEPVMTIYLESEVT